MLVVTLITQGCNDDFLERFPETDISKENFFNTEEDLQTYALSLYDFPAFDIYIRDHSTDNAATTGNTELKNMMIGTPSATTITAGWNFDQLRKINFFLENLPKSTVDDATKNHYEGIGRFFRAKFYMEMVMRYSDVPWYEKTLTANDPEMYKPRDSRTAVVDKIFVDYAFAREHVMEDDRSGIVNKWVVLSFFARHALYEGTFRKYHTELSLQGTAENYLQLARDVSEQIMDDGGFSLHDTDQPSVDYGNLFNSTDLSGNTEVILGRLFQNESLNSGWWAYMFGNYEANPVRGLLQSYLMEDGTPFTSLPNYQTKLFVEEFTSRDSRLQQTYAYPGWELINTSTYAQGAGIYVQQLTKNFSGYHQLKGFINNTDVAVQNNIDIPLIRFAEILLINAESKAELGELTQGGLDATINQLRDRAGMPPLAMNPALDPVLQQQYPLVAGPMANVLLEIRRERRVELALEGFRFDDLMRWHAGKLIETEPEGIYFPGLGKFDMTGDNVEDIILIPNSQSVPAEDAKEQNSLGEKLIYYRVGPQGSDASFYLSNGTSGTAVTDPERGQFQEPKFYYRPVPQTEVTLNPALTQIFNW